MSSVGTKAPLCGPNTGSLAPGVRQRAKKKSLIFIIQLKLVILIGVEAASVFLKKRILNQTNPDINHYIKKGKILNCNQLWWLNGL